MMLLESLNTSLSYKNQGNIRFTDYNLMEIFTLNL